MCILRGPNPTLDETANDFRPAQNVGDIVADQLGHKGRARVPLVGATSGLWGNIVVVVSMASPSMAWISLAKPIMDVVAACAWLGDFPWGQSPYGCDRELSRERTMTVAKEVAA